MSKERRGTQPELSHWFEAEVDGLYDLVLTRLGNNEALAAEVVEATFAQALASGAALRSGTLAGSEWLRGLALAQIADRHDPAAVETPWHAESLQTLYGEIDCHPLPDKVLRGSLSQAFVGQVLGTLPGDYLELLRQTAAGRTPAEIAQRNQTTEDMVRAQLRSARSAFRETLMSRMIHLEIAPIRDPAILSANVAKLLGSVAAPKPLDQERRSTILHALHQQQAAITATMKASERPKGVASDRRKLIWIAAALFGLPLLVMAGWLWHLTAQTNVLQRNQQARLKAALIAEMQGRAVSLPREEAYMKAALSQLQMHNQTNQYSQGRAVAYTATSFDTYGVFTDLPHHEMRLFKKQDAERKRLMKALGVQSTAFVSYEQDVARLLTQEIEAAQKVIEPKLRMMKYKEQYYEESTKIIETANSGEIQDRFEAYEKRLKSPPRANDFFDRDALNLAIKRSLRDELALMISESRPAAVQWIGANDKAIRTKAAELLEKRLELASAVAELGVNSTKAVNLNAAIRTLETEVDDLVARYYERLERDCLELGK